MKTPEEKSTRDESIFPSRTVKFISVRSLMEELEEEQHAKLLKLGRRIVPTLTPEDMLQPNDYPELEHHPEFRYEEGILAGIRTAKAALFAAESSSI